MTETTPIEHPSDGTVKTNVLGGGITETWEYVEHDGYGVNPSISHGHWTLVKIDHPESTERNDA